MFSQNALLNLWAIFHLFPNQYFLWSSPKSATCDPPCHIFNLICLVAVELSYALLLFFFFISSPERFVLWSETPTHPPNCPCLQWLITLLLLRSMFDSLHRSFLFISYFFLFCCGICMCIYIYIYIYATFSWYISGACGIYFLYASAGINSASRNYFKYWRTDFMYVHVVLLMIWGIYLRKWFARTLITRTLRYFKTLRNQIYRNPLLPHSSEIIINNNRP